MRERLKLSNFGSLGGHRLGSGRSPSDFRANTERDWNFTTTSLTGQFS